MSKTLFRRDANAYFVTSDERVELVDTLPPLTFSVAFNPMAGGFFLEIIEPMPTPPKIYGDVDEQAQRMLRTFEDRPSGTGVLLYGEKGSGKTMMARHLSAECAQRGIPTIVVNQPFAGDAFNKFVQSIPQACLVLFDEFEKLYDEDGQKALLTLLDGTMPSKKLYVMTSNSWGVDYHLKNRPGRIYYSIEYTGLGDRFVREYCADALQDQSYTDQVVVFSRLFYSFNFDMLKALVEEMNRFGESPRAASRILNARPTESGRGRYEMELKIDGVKMELAREQWAGDPYSDDPDAYYLTPKGRKGEKETQVAEFETRHLRRVETDGTLVFENGSAQLRLWRSVKSKWTFSESELELAAE